MAEIWPWEAIPLSPQNMLKILGKGTPEIDQRPEEEIWNLRSEIIGKECLWRKDSRYESYVGELPCKWYYTTKDTHQHIGPGGGQEVACGSKRETLMSVLHNSLVLGLG